MEHKDFIWSLDKQPHLNRRIEMLKKYPEIKELMGYDTNLAVQVVFRVCIQIISLWFLKDASWTTLIIMAYCFGGMINHSLTLAIHEIGHNLAFGQKRLLWNRVIGIIASLPLGVPMSNSFKKYHLIHHKMLGYQNIDPDIPTELEACLFKNKLTKMLWLFLMPFFYTIRPVVIYPISLSKIEKIEILVHAIFYTIISLVFGPRMWGYLLLGTILCTGLHPIAGHLIAEHYMFRKGFETYSYYGPFNYICFNVGYHMEHHDFPNIPASKLPLLRKIAPDYYEILPSHTSWTKVMYDFVTDPDVGLHSRMRRKEVKSG